MREKRVIKWNYADAWKKNLLVLIKIEINFEN